MPKIGGFMRLCAGILGVSLLIGMIAAIAREGAQEFSWLVLLISAALIFAALEGRDPIDGRTDEEIARKRGRPMLPDRATPWFVPEPRNRASRSAPREKEPVPHSRRSD